MSGPKESDAQKQLEAQQQAMMAEQQAELRAKKEDLIQTRLGIVKSQGAGSYTPTMPNSNSGPFPPRPGPAPIPPNPFNPPNRGI